MPGACLADAGESLGATPFTSEAPSGNVTPDATYRAVSDDLAAAWGRFRPSLQRFWGVAGWRERAHAIQIRARGVSVYFIEVISTPAQVLRYSTNAEDGHRAEIRHERLIYERCHAADRESCGIRRLAKGTVAFGFFRKCPDYGPQFCVENDIIAPVRPIGLVR